VSKFRICVSIIMLLAIAMRLVASDWIGWRQSRRELQKRKDDAS